MPQKSNINEFIQKANSVHGADNFSYINSIYINNRTKIQIHCNKCNEDFWQTPHNHLMGDGCPYCAGKNKTTEKFIQESQSVHGLDAYNYENVVYKSAWDKVKIICNKCGRLFMQSPRHHLDGHGCPYCNFSFGEKLIKNILKKHNIKVEFQKKFCGCKDKLPLPFDFYLPDYNICIEYQGEQHYKPRFFIRKCGKEKGIKRFNDLKRHDNIKQKFCKQNNIQLIEINYKENIEEKLNQCLLKKHKIVLY